MWKLRVSVDGGQIFWVQTPFTEYNDAKEHCRRLYGNTIEIVGQEFEVQN